MEKPSASPSGSAPTASFAVRLVNIDVVSTIPVHGIDPEWCSFESRPVKRVPIIRIFGATPAGQHCCVHVHNTLPYFFLDFPSDLGEVSTTKEKVYAYIHRLFSSIEAAMDLSLGKTVGSREKGQYIHDIQIVRGKPFYGFALNEKFYLKIFLYNPFLLNRMTTLLRTGAIMQTNFQPYEAHIPFLLQFFVDFNLFGMEFVKFSKAKFRTPLPVRRKRLWRNIEYDVASISSSGSQWSQQQIGSQRLSKRWYCSSTIRDDEISPIVDRRESNCDLEVDVMADDIVNYLDRIGTPASNDNRKLVTSLAALWEDESDRRRREGASPLGESFLEIGEDEKRNLPKETLLVQQTKKKLQKIIADEKQFLAQHEPKMPSPSLKPVPGRNVSFSTSQKQQIMSQGPLHQCPSLIEDFAAASGSSTPASLFPNTPRANMTFGELQKHGIQRPDSYLIAAAARELYPSASQQDLPEGSFAEPDVNENVVVSQSASMDEGMLDILNWMQDQDEQNEDVDLDLPGAPGDPRQKSDRLAYNSEDSEQEANDIEQSQREIEKELDDAIVKEESLADEDREIFSSPSQEPPTANSEMSLIEETEVDLFADDQPPALAADIVKLPPASSSSSIASSQQDPHSHQNNPSSVFGASWISAKEEEQIKSGTEIKVSQPMLRPVPMDMKPLKSALKRRSSWQERSSAQSTRSTKQPAAFSKRSTALKMEEDDEIIFTQPEGVKERSHKRKRGEDAVEAEETQIRRPRKRVKFDETVAVFTIATDSLEITDKKNIRIFFDDIPKRRQRASAPLPVASASKIQPSSISLNYEKDGNSSIESDQLDFVDQIEAAEDSSAAIPEPPPASSEHPGDVLDVVQDESMDIDEEDPLQVEVVRASQSEFRLPQPSPSQRSQHEPLTNITNAEVESDPNNFRISLRSRPMVQLIYDEDDGIDLEPATSAPIRPEIIEKQNLGDELLFNSQSESSESEQFNSTPPLQDLVQKPPKPSRFSPNSSNLIVSHERQASNPNMPLPDFSPIKSATRATSAAVALHPQIDKTNSPSRLNDSVPAEQPEPEALKSSTLPLKSLSVPSRDIVAELVLSTQQEERNREVESAESPLFVRDGGKRFRIFAFAKHPPTARMIIKGLQNVGRPHLQYQEPFYGVAEDPAKFNQPKDKMIGNKIDLQSFAISKLPAFGREVYQSVQTAQKQYPSLCLLQGPTGRRLRCLTPARLPPSRITVLSIASHPKTQLLSAAEELDLQDPVPGQDQKNIEEELSASPMAWPGMAHHAPKVIIMKSKSSIKGNIGAKKQDASQIEQPTPNNSFGFLFSQGFEPTVGSSSESSDNQGLCMISLEVHVQTRGELRPDPKLDAVSCVYLAIRDENIVKSAGLMYRDLLMLLKVAQKTNPNEASSTDRVFDGLAVPRYVRQEYDTELSLLQGLVKIFEEFDPDIAFGYEIQSGSLGYLLDRAQALKFDLAAQLSRLAREQQPNASTNNTTSYFDKERDPWGFTHGSGIHIAGRSVVNIWRVLRSEIKSTSYTFENTAFHVLHARVPLYTHKTLTNLFDNPISQWRVHLYFLERVQCNLYLLDALNVVGRTSEMARLYGITFFDVLSRGSQFRVESLVMRLTKPHNYILISPSKQQVAAQLAPECIPLVMEPQSGFYQDPLLVLDFQSLYPSIIIGYNYCYSTCLGRVQPGQGPNNTKKFGASHVSIPRGALDHLQDVLNISPNEVMFLKPEVQVGILPRMLVEILETRVMVKNAMKRAKKDKALYRLLDARQLALKLLANVTYGYTSASFSGRMPCVDIADAIVQTGRETLERAIRTVNSHPTWHARVVYGDTDSLFVLVEGASRERAFEVGNEIADTITNMNPWPVKLKFEKMYLPSLLLAKKRYVGYMYESKEQSDAVFDAKGIETVRRDSCPAVAKIMEKSLTLLFEKRDLSEIRTFVQRQFSKMMTGRANLSDFIFRKEVRLGTYAPGKPAPPAALVATKEMARDPRAEPQYGERVPYIVAAGHHQSRLIDLVYHPDAFLKYPDRLRPNANYYITKQVVPSLARVFSLIGVDVAAWYTSMPKNIRLLQQMSMPAKTAAGGPNAKSRIDQYYLSQHCPICDELTRKGLCEKCAANKQSSAYILSVRMRHLQQQLHHLNEVCVQCQGTREPQIDCVSLDCAILFERNKIGVAHSNVIAHVKSLGD